LVIYRKAHRLDNHDNINLILTHQQTDTADKVYVSGEIDISNIKELDTALQESILSGSSEAVVIDMRNVGFVGIVAIRSLLSAYKAADELGKKFCLQNPSRVTQRLFNLTGLEDAVPVQFVTEDE
jgi:anti-anti-sigma factor